MKNIILSLLMIGTCINTNIAQADTTFVSKLGVNINGSIDSYYRTNISNDFDSAPATSFANLPGFSLGMANLIINQEGQKFGFTADFVFGPRGEDATFLSPLIRPEGSSNIINQLYTYWNVSDAVKLTLGNFNTFLGYEVISPSDNFNYSTSYLFSYGPFSHTGFKVDVTLDGGFSVMAGVFNPTDATEFNPTNDYAGGVQVGYENGGLGIWANGLFADDYTQLDITAGYEFNDNIYGGINASVVANSFWGYAGYLQVAATDDLKIGVRVESFTDTGLELFTKDESVLDVTLSANYTIGNLTLIPEIRTDLFSENIDMDNGESMSNLSSFVLAAVYSF